MFGEPLNGINKGAGIMADLEVAGGKAVGAAFLLLTGQFFRIKFMAVINIPPVFI